ncbi:ABC transporter ATP-binding protein [Patescibacteria group bacterium]|nr:ABC transporter ATP-binding protein [Patescibacteria group bacterium]
MEKSKPEIVIELTKLAKRYDDEAGVYDALKKVELKVRAGEFLAVMGPSGSGKSTLMNIIGLLDRPTQGNYLLDGVDTNTLSDKDLAKLRRDRIGFIFQNFNLLPRLSIMQNVELPLIYQKIRTAERKRRVREVLSEVGILDKIDSKPNRVSGGQVQRAAIARALINKPSLILADEPTGNLDTKTGLGIMELLKKLNNDGVTIVLVTHNPELSHYASRIVEVRDGLLSEKEVRK